MLCFMSFGSLLSVPRLEELEDKPDAVPVYGNFILISWWEPWQATAYTQSLLYAITCLSVCPSHGWISQKWLKLGLRNFHRTVATFL